MRVEFRIIVESDNADADLAETRAEVVSALDNAEMYAYVSYGEPIY